MCPGRYGNYKKLCPRWGGLTSEVKKERTMTPDTIKQARASYKDQDGNRVPPHFRVHLCVRFLPIMQYFRSWREEAVRIQYISYSYKHTQTKSTFVKQG